MKKKAPPQVMVGGGASDEFGGPLHIAEFWARELEQARDMRLAAQSVLAEANALTVRTRSLQEPEASEAHARVRALMAQAAPQLAAAEAIRKKIVAKMEYVIDRAEQRARGEKARADVRRKAGEPTRIAFTEAMKTTLAAGESVTPAHLRARWKGVCPSDRQLHNLIHNWSTEASK